MVFKGTFFFLPPCPLDCLSEYNDKYPSKIFWILQPPSKGIQPFNTPFKPQREDKFIIKKASKVGKILASRSLSCAVPEEPYL